MKMKDTLAKAIRTITVPPILSAAMLLIFRYVYGNDFITVPLLILEILFFVILPVSAYPLTSMKKKEGESTRERQRKLAFLLNLLGYVLALLVGIACGCSQMLLTILLGYFLSVLVLTIVNKIFKVRASGHACSCVLPYLFFCHWLGNGAIWLCAILYVAEFWASVRLKRHTVQEFLLGSVIAAGVFGLVVNLI